SAALVALRLLIMPSFADGAADPSPGSEARADALLADPPALASWIRQRNPDVGAAVERVEQSRADFRASRLFPNPSLSAGLSDVTVGATNPPGLAFSDTAIYGLTLSEAVEIGKRGPRAASARLRLGAEHESYLAALNEATGDARYALGRIAYLRAKAAALEESLSAARQVLELQRSRMENGDLSRHEHDRPLLD